MSSSLTSAPFASSALLGFVGGDQTATALYLTHIAGRQRIPTLVNSPGSYFAARALAVLHKARVWDGLHPGVSVDPCSLASPSTTPGPKFIASVSGTILDSTGPIAQELLEHTRSLSAQTVSGRRTTPLAVTIVELPDAPHSELHPTARISAPVFLPILASAAAATFCGLTSDYTTLAAIAFGMLCSAGASRALHAGDLTFTRPLSTPGATVGDGYLETGNEFIVLRGSETAVAAVTRGQMTLRFRSECTHRSLAFAALLLGTQCVAQLLLLPLGTLLGQLAFLLATAAAWLYHAHVARQAPAAWRRLVLEDVLSAPAMARYSVGTRTAAAVVLMRLLRPADVEEQLARLLPNNTPVWKLWRETVAQRLRSGKPAFVGADVPVPVPATFDMNERRLFHTLLADAQCAVDAFSGSYKL
ncbi:uncharacterized protein BXZ73DRAFT_86525 [Epithele typhae]|uniref:uncharacterized protein n=1 Tax=Epithele typhae TaxID=378194 RepID=UPI002007A5C6|nr:uncharacterized protein BXZ73DRAFT_86525 [Epithele typhae]KAH9946396.1 hypothetical protein BXZ73DRAFT_86525 [Epithele typhae]